MAKNAPTVQSENAPKRVKMDKNGQKIGKNGQLVVIWTLDSSQRDVPVYMVFLQGVLTVPVGCLAK